MVFFMWSVFDSLAFLCGEPPYFWTLVANEKHRLDLTRLAFKWLYEQIQGLTPPPTEDSQEWHRLMLDSIRTWKNLLKRGAAHAHG